TSVARVKGMSRQLKGALLAMGFVAAFILSIVFHSIVASVIVLLCAVTVSYVVGIAWMRTSTHRTRGKEQSSPH
ncbi:MAG: hypothetical protein ABJB12_13470, partial [Pseudomonadota bacterium]